TEYLVLELGMNHFGEMRELTAVAKPDLVVITNIGSMHIEHLGSREGILQAKLEILEGLRPGGTAVFNGDEPLLWGLHNIQADRIIYFGMENDKCDIRAKNLETPEGGIRFTIEGLGQHFDVYVPMEGRHSTQNATAAAAVAVCCNVLPANIQTALSRFQNTDMRQKTYEAKGYTIIDDCYNAGPESMEAAILVLGDKKVRGRRIAVLGDMLELGDRSAAEHYRIGRIAANKTDMILAYGPNAERIISGAMTGGMKNNQAMCFDTQEEMVNALVSRARPGDVLLFKGSRGMRMEKALELFLELQPEPL
ncbi:MAG: UDP-N-acetylmuramoyl-tripeptide--D-alanyl-D-alanine ligase, partial [Oscillospiraceae bacterium]|nr:UDP-N-acetylmuramoyl-tripeptide--D-alanyl-D-alanine ligase [Oscillospiraceae bacterium]